MQALTANLTQTHCIHSTDVALLCIYIHILAVTWHIESETHRPAIDSCICRLHTFIWFLSGRGWTNTCFLLTEWIQSEAVRHLSERDSDRRHLDRRHLEGTSDVYVNEEVCVCTGST